MVQRLIRLHVALVSMVLLTLIVSCASLPAATRLPRAVRADVVPGRGVIPAGLLIEPEAGVRPLVRAIDRSQRSIFVECYILSDRNVIHALERAAAQGVEVSVLLERHPWRLGPQPDRVADALRASGVGVRWTRRGFQFTHAKVMVLDDRLAIISSGNFSRATFTKNRDLLVFDRQPSDVRQVSSIFRSDWDRMAAILRDPNLLVSPDNSQVKLFTLIRSARHSVAIYAEEVADAAVEHLLTAVVQRGVKVRLLIAPGANPRDLSVLSSGGVAVRELATPYIHAKMVAVDGRVAFVGSENLSVASLQRNREMGIVLRGRAVTRLARVFERDWKRGRAVP